MQWLGGGIVGNLKEGDWVRTLEIALLIPITGLLLFPWRWLPWLGLILVALTWVLRRISTGRFMLPTVADGPILTLSLMAGIGYLISVDRGVSAARGWALLLGLVLFYAFANNYRTLRDTRRLSVLVALLPIGVALLGLVAGDWGNQRMVNIHGLYDFMPTLIRGLPGSGVPGSGGLINPRWFGIALGYLIPVPLALAAFGRGARLRAFSAGATLFSGAVLLLTQSVQGLAALLAGVFFLAVWRTRWALALLPLAAGVILATLLWVGPLTSAVYALSIDNPLGIGIVLRMDMWSRAWAMIQDMPMTGVGLNTYPLMQSHFYPGFIIGSEAHAHNLYLQTLVDLGLPGLLALLGLLIFWLWAVRRNYLAVFDWDYRVLIVGLAAGVVGYYTHGFIDALMLGSKPGVFLWVLLGMGAARPTQVQEALDNLLQSTPLEGWALLYPVGVILAALGLVVVFRPAALPMNLAGLRLYPALYQLETGSGLDETPGELLSVLPLLEDVRQRDPGSLQAWELTARVHAWSGDYLTATSAMEQRVLLDIPDPMHRYYPPESWLRYLRGQPASDWEALNIIYTRWKNRYPQQAENYVRFALLWESYRGYPERAARIVQMGLDEQAQPQGWLEHYLAQIEG